MALVVVWVAEMGGQFPVARADAYFPHSLTPCGLPARNVIPGPEFWQFHLDRVPLAAL